MLSRINRGNSRESEIRKTRKCGSAKRRACFSKNVENRKTHLFVLFSLAIIKSDQITYMHLWVRRQK